MLLYIILLEKIEALHHWTQAGKRHKGPLGTLFDLLSLWVKCPALYAS